VWLCLAALVSSCGALRKEPPPPSLAAIQEEPSPTPQEFRALKGEVAQLQEDLAEVKRTNVNALVKIGELYGVIEQLQANLATGAQASPETKPAETAVRAPGGQEEQEMTTARAAYDAALKLYEAGQYAEAAPRFEAYVASFPNDPLADNAQYWLAESYYARKAYLQALEAFEQVVARYPEGNKVPDALLKIGMSYARLGEYEKAVGKFEELIQRYPLSPLVGRAGEEIRRIREQGQ